MQTVVSTFTDNTAGDDGGAIYWEGDHGTINNITCEDNRGISFNESHSKGGTICLTGNDVTISNSIIKNTSAADDGGAIFVSGNNVMTPQFQTVSLKNVMQHKVGQSMWKVTEQAFP